MTSNYGTKRWILIGAVPKHPLKFRSVNEAQIFIQNLKMKVTGLPYGEANKKFNSTTSITDEVKKLGYDGIIINGREMVLFDPQESNIIVFTTEQQVKNYYNSINNII